MDQNGHACLGGLGIATIVGIDTHLDISDPNFWHADHHYYYGIGLQWASSEHMLYVEATKKSDVYDLGIVIYEVCLFTHIQPW